MIICKSVGEINSLIDEIPSEKVVALVPTMGALHKGHIALVKSALACSRYTVVSIFVNPTQFNNRDDFNRYPRTIEEDCRKLEEAGVFALFMPSFDEIYPSGEDKIIFDLGGLDKTGEGRRREGHFNGVVQIVSRLFEIVKPKYAFFGEKDFQQLAIIEFMTRRLGYPVQIVPSPTVREESGLAMSSRNMLLTDAQRVVAPKIFEALLFAKSAVDEVFAGRSTLSPSQLSDMVTIRIDSEPLLRVEYVEIINAKNMQIIERWSDAEDIRICTAVYAEPIRLIDNIKLR